MQVFVFSAFAGGKSQFLSRCETMLACKGEVIIKSWSVGCPADPLSKQISASSELVSGIKFFGSHTGEKFNIEQVDDIRSFTRSCLNVMSTDHEKLRRGHQNCAFSHFIKMETLFCRHTTNAYHVVQSCSK